MEGQRYACSWKKEGQFYHVWVKKRPKLSAKAKTFNQADHRLWGIIIEATGDGESIREYDPPPPEAATEHVDIHPVDMSAWIRRLKKHRRRASKREPLDTNAKILRRFARCVEKHFGFLRDLGLKGPQVSRQYRADTGMTFRARFASKKRTVDIDLDKPHREYSGGTSFIVNPVPVVDQSEWFLSTMYVALRNSVLGNLLADLEATHTL